MFSLHFLMSKANYLCSEDPKQCPAPSTHWKSIHSVVKAVVAISANIYIYIRYLNIYIYRHRIIKVIEDK